GRRMTHGARGRPRWREVAWLSRADRPAAKARGDMARGLAGWLSHWYETLMRVPQWLTLLVAAWVIIFGLYRLWLARDPAQDKKREEGKKGLFAMRRRTHALIGIVYILLGIMLIATSFGWNPLSGLTAPSTDAPAGKGSAAPARPGPRT